MYQREADDIRELKQQLIAQISQGALMKEENLTLQHSVSCSILGSILNNLTLTKLQAYQATAKGETAKLRELQKAFEELSHSHAELKQVWQEIFIKLYWLVIWFKVARAAVHKEGQTSALVQELTALVKKLKAKEQKVQRKYALLEEDR